MLNKKIIYIIKTSLEKYPPCIAQIKYLKNLNQNFEVLIGSSDTKIIKFLDENNIKYKEFKEIKPTKNLLKKLFQMLNYRRLVKKEIKNRNKKEIILWYGTVESAIPLIAIGIPFVLTSLELLDDKKNYLKKILVGLLAKKAEIVIACEETRAYLMKYWYNLKKLPYVLPNKPYYNILETNSIPDLDITKKIVEEIKNKKIIIYQGIFQNIEYISAVARALKILNKDYYLLLMGYDYHNKNIINVLKEIYEKIIYISPIPAPFHLKITSCAYIGIVYYDNDTLNKVFCAPNKIYEYSGFGIPALGNNIPGLKNTIGMYQTGVCTDFNTENILEAISEIEKNYNFYSKNARKFYNATNNLSTMEKIINELEIKV